MKKWGVIICALMLLTGCRLATLGGQGGIIDWVDFVIWDGTEYDQIHSGVLADQFYIGEQIGAVKFKVADNVSNPKYKVKNGDAAFHEKGTKLYNIKGHPHLLAVESPNAINGYDVYFARDDAAYIWQFQDMPKQNVKKIEIYRTVPPGYELISEWTNDEDIRQFLKLLTSGETDSTFEPHIGNEDPDFYEMVFYTEDPIAYKFGMAFDGQTYYWHPANTEVLSDEIGLFLHGK